MRRTRCHYASMYHAGLSGLTEVSLPESESLEDDAWHLYPIQLHLNRLRATREEIIRELHGRRIGTSVHFIPLHLHPFYQKSYGYRRKDFPNASYVFERLILLPIYSRMSEQDVHDVITAVYDVVNDYRI